MLERLGEARSGPDLKSAWRVDRGFVVAHADRVGALSLFVRRAGGVHVGVLDEDEDIKPEPRVRRVQHPAGGEVNGMTNDCGGVGLGQRDRFAGGEGRGG